MTSLVHRCSLQAMFDDTRGSKIASTSTKQAVTRRRLGHRKDKKSGAAGVGTPPGSRLQLSQKRRDAQCNPQAARCLSHQPRASENGTPLGGGSHVGGIQRWESGMNRESGSLDRIPYREADVDGFAIGCPGAKRAPRMKKQRALQQIQDTGIIACLNTSE